VGTGTWWALVGLVCGSGRSWAFVDGGRSWALVRGGRLSAWYVVVVGHGHSWMVGGRRRWCMVGSRGHWYVVGSRRLGMW